MSQIIRYVDRDESTGTQDGLSWATAYQLLNDCLTAEAQDLVAGGNFMTILFRASAGTADTTPVTINCGGGANWKCDVVTYNNYIEIIQVDAPPLGVWSDLVGRLEVTNASCFDISGAFADVRFIDVQVNPITTSATTRGFACGANFAADPSCRVILDSCRIKAVHAGGSANIIGVTMSNYGTYRFYSSTFWGDNSSKGTALLIDAGLSQDIRAYNVVIYKWAMGGGRQTLGDGFITNSVIAACTDDILASRWTADYCCSEDEDGTNTNGPKAGVGDWSEDFVDADNGNFTPVEGANILVPGLDDPSSGEYSVDIRNAEYVSGSWARGVYAGVGGGGDEGLMFGSDF